MKISVFGMGYVGLVTALYFAEQGHSVLGIDIDEQKVAGLKRGILPIYEPSIDAVLVKNYEHDSVAFSADLKLGIQSSDILFLCIGTPSLKDGSADISGILDFSGLVAEHMTSNKIVVIKSTVPVGTCEDISARINASLLKSKKSFTCDVVSNPEFLREGYAWVDALNPSRIIIGSSSVNAVSVLRELYAWNKTVPFLVMDSRSSELTKYAANSLLAAKISLMNEISRICEVTGADIEEVRKGVSSDPRIGEAFTYAGVGYGGSCLPKDVRALIATGKKYGRPAEILEKVDQVNVDQRGYFFSRIFKELGDCRNKRIAIWGTAFKPETDDVREAPAIEFILQALEAGAVVNIFDPLASHNTQKQILERRPDLAPKLVLASGPYEALPNVEALILFTEWSQFLNPDFAKIKGLMKTSTIFDGRNVYSPQLLKSEGLKCFSIGRRGVD